jgi:2-hydroxychromene-2-carboxylate isomerase
MISVYYDYASPWSYLASELVETRLPGETIDWRPIYLRGLPQFREGMPYAGAKLRYMGLDLLRCAAHEGVPLRFPSTFPVNGLSAVRGALAARALGAFAPYHQAMFRAAWRDDRDIGRREVVVEVAVEAGLDRERFVALLEAPETKERLRADTAAAEARGVFGAPTFFVGRDPDDADAEMFWGHDRLDYVARAAARISQR